jgi:hypothetical protein
MKPIQVYAPLAAFVTLAQGQSVTFSGATPLHRPSDCRKSNKPSADPNHPYTASLFQRRDLECEVCKQVVKASVKALPSDQQPSEEQIFKGVSDACSGLPKKDRTECDGFVEQYENELFEVLESERDPSLACTSLGVCV